MRNYIVKAAEFGLCLICILVCLGSGSIVRGQTTGTAENFKLPQGFKAELMHRVPQDQGSWVAITNDPQGRLITSDQYGKLYRLTPRETGPADAIH